MLSIIDKYIIKKFLSTFFFMLGVIMILAVVFDVAERLSEFIENEAPMSAIIGKYYLNFVMYFRNMFSSMIVFLSVIWFTAKMAQETEIIPILNSETVQSIFKALLYWCNIFTADFACFKSFCFANIQ